MGGAARNARKKRQAQTATRGKPAVTKGRSVDRKPVIIGVVVVVLLLGAVIGGVVYTSNKKNATEGQNIAAKDTTQLDDAATGAKGDDVTYPVARDGAAVLVGQKSAKVTLDLYEDFLCPVCHQFETTYGDSLAQHVKDGSLRLRYHMLPLLNDSSDPPGYSLDSANAGLCAADAGKFPEFHTSLYDAQPEEGARGWDKQQLAKLGQDLGIKDAAFKSCVESGKYDSIIQSGFNQIRTAPYLQQDINGQTGFGTPTVANGHKVVDTSDAKWLDKVLASAS